MRDPDPSTLWQISAFERHRNEGAQSAFAGVAPASRLSTTMVSELMALEQRAQGGDVLTVMGVCMRQRENALLLLQHQDLVWPITLFPRELLYHCPRPLDTEMRDSGLDLKLLEVAPAGLRPPGSSFTERVGNPQHYRALQPLLWTVAMQGPRARLFDEIGGHAAYRVTPDFLPGPLRLGGAVGAAYERLRTEIAPLRDIARWPGMTLDRAVRLLNALFVQGGLIVLRAHHAARQAPVPLGWPGRRRS
jgi:hypothetical protein